MSFTQRRIHAKAEKTDRATMSGPTLFTYEDREILRSIWSRMSSLDSLLVKIDLVLSRLEAEEKGVDISEGTTTDLENAASFHEEKVKQPGASSPRAALRTADGTLLQTSVKGPRHIRQWLDLNLSQCKLKNHQKPNQSKDQYFHSVSHSSLVPRLSPRPAPKIADRSLLQTPVKGSRLAPVATSISHTIETEIPSEAQPKPKPRPKHIKDFPVQPDITKITMRVATPVEEEISYTSGVDGENKPGADSDDDDDDDDTTITESGEKYEKTDRIEDIMFEEENEMDEEDDETDTSIQEEVDAPIEVKEGQSTEDEVNDSSSEESETAIMMVPSVDKEPTLEVYNENTVTVTIYSLVLDEDSAVIEDDNVQRVYVEYRFLRVDASELETTVPLPKLKQNKPVYFNFKKVFHIDPEKNKLRRDYLASMLLPEDPSEGKIRFTVVSEPPEDHQSLDYEDIGHAYVDVRQILRSDRDVTEQDIDVYDAEDSETVIGVLNVTVECLAALKVVEKELPNPVDISERMNEDQWSTTDFTF